MMAPPRYVTPAFMSYASYAAAFGLRRADVDAADYALLPLLNAITPYAS